MVLNSQPVIFRKIGEARTFGTRIPGLKRRTSAKFGIPSPVSLCLPHEPLFHDWTALGLGTTFMKSMLRQRDSNLLDDRAVPGVFNELSQALIT
jgi:hypothetical protein